MIHNFLQDNGYRQVHFRFSDFMERSLRGGKRPRVRYEMERSSCNSAENSRRLYSGTLYKMRLRGSEQLKSTYSRDTVQKGEEPCHSRLKDVIRRFLEPVFFRKKELRCEEG